MYIKHTRNNYRDPATHRTGFLADQYAEQDQLARLHPGYTADRPQGVQFPLIEIASFNAIKMDKDDLDQMSIIKQILAVAEELE